MNKIPVGQTIRFAYDFTFGQIGTVIGLIWIPTVINAVGSFLVFRAYGGTMEQPDGAGVPVMGGPQIGLMFLYFLVAFLLVAMMAVAITRQALGLRKGTAFAHFSLGSQELRVFGGFFGLYLVLLLFVFAFAVVAVMAALGGSGGALDQGRIRGQRHLPAWASSLLGLAGFCVLIYVFVRLSFLFIPAAVSEGEFGLTRSWELTRGNFWRIVAVGLAVLLPVVLVQCVAEYFILGPAYFASFMAAAGDPDACGPLFGGAGPDRPDAACRCCSAWA